MRIFTLMTFAWAVLVGTVGSAAATPITYTEKFTASGRLGGTSFSNADVVLTFTGDTANVSSSDPDGTKIFKNLLGTATISIAGIGTATFTDPTGVFSNPAFGSAGFIGLDVDRFSDQLIIASTINPGLIGYELDSAIGPTGLSRNVCNCGNNSEYNTTGGILLFSEAGDSTFSATISAIPEPSSLMLSAFGIAGFGLLRSRRTAFRK